jgi:hypothetical protein
MYCTSSYSDTTATIAALSSLSALTTEYLSPCLASQRSNLNGRSRPVLTVLWGFGRTFFMRLRILSSFQPPYAIQIYAGGSSSRDEGLPAPTSCFPQSISTCSLFST